MLDIAFDMLQRIMEFLIYERTAFAIDTDDIEVRRKRI